MKRTAIVAGFAVGLALFAAVAAGAAGGAATQSDAETNGSFGSEVSSFIQVSSAEAESEVNDGMFVAALERTDDPEQRRALVEEREDELAERQERLQDRQERLNEIDSVAQYAVATEVAVGAGELEQAANRTKHAAEAAGVNDTALAEIRASASEMRGRAITAIAGNIGTAADDGNGPPVDLPPTANDSDDGDDADGDDSNQSDDRGNQSDDRGNQSDAGNSSEDDSNGDEDSSDDGGDDSDNGDDGGDDENSTESDEEDSEDGNGDSPDDPGDRSS